MNELERGVMNQASEADRPASFPSSTVDTSDTANQNNAAGDTDGDVIWTAQPLYTESNQENVHGSRPQEYIPQTTERGVFGERLQAGCLPRAWSHSVKRHLYIEFVLYIIFLVLFCVTVLVPTAKRSYDAYRLVQSVEQTLLSQILPEPGPSFNNIMDINGMYSWLRGPFISNLYSRPLVPGDASHAKTSTAHWYPGFYLASTTILGPIRLRQLRVKPNSCKIGRRFRKFKNQVSCNAPYRRKVARSRRGDNNGLSWPGLNTEPLMNVTTSKFWDGTMRNLSSAFVFQTNTSAGNYFGTLALYDAGGYLVDLPSSNATKALEILSLLHENKWLDGQTRAVFVEFTLYLAHIDLILSARLVLEVHPTGTVVKAHALEPMLLEPFRDSKEWLIYVGVFCWISVTLNMIWEVYMGLHFRNHFTRRSSGVWVWAVLGILVYLGVFVMGGLSIHNIVQRYNLTYQDGVYFPTHLLGYLVSMERGLTAFLSFIIWFRILKYTSELPRIGILGRTLGRALPQVAAFFFMSSVIFLAFAQAFFMAYYATVPGYQTYLQSFMSVLRFTVGDFDYQALSNENRTLTPILFSLLLVMVFFVWVNVVIAIISSVYEDERNQSLGFAWDLDFEGFTPDSEHAENDVRAMRLHAVECLETSAGPDDRVGPTMYIAARDPGVEALVSENLPEGGRPLVGNAEYVALTPERFQRYRFAKLACFMTDSLITINIRNHLETDDDTINAMPFFANYGDHPGRSRGLSSQADSSPLDDPTSPNGLMHSPYFSDHTDDHQADVASTSAPQARIDSGGATRDLKGGHSHNIQRSESSASDESFRHVSIHTGVFARMGHVRGAVPKAETSGNHAPASIQNESVQLQAVYFDRDHHNLTTANKWWSEHKHHFDTGEQFMADISNTVRHIAQPIGRILGSTVGAYQKTISRKRATRSTSNANSEHSVGDPTSEHNRSQQRRSIRNSRSRSTSRNNRRKT